MRPHRRIKWPDGNLAAFAIFDDTDNTTLENGPPVYELLTDLELRVTKSVWPLAPSRPALVGGSTCGDPDYLNWVLALQRGGHEIGFHNATDHPSVRHDTIRALDRFEEMFGHSPRVGADHAGNMEAMYWGPSRLTGMKSIAYALAQKVMRPNRASFSGEVPTSDYFWGDVCRNRITYWRNFCFDEIDLCRVSPKMPYHDPRRSYVNYWFTSTDGSNLPRFLRHMTDDKLDRLESGSGVCIMYTHFGLGFATPDRVDPGLVHAMRRLASRRIWVAPVSEVLDHIRAQADDSILTDRERWQLENRWVLDRIRDSGFIRKRMRL